MRYAIVSDIHANLEAFAAVLKDIDKRGVDTIWCLGDIVDYGPDPHECIELLRQRDHIAVPGNHDLAAIGKIDTTDFHPDAVVSSLWTGWQLLPEDVDYLGNLPTVIAEGDFTLVHASPRDPIWEYVKSADIAGENLAYFKSRYCFFGHTHRPGIYFARGKSGCSPEQFPGEDGFILAGDRLLLNPGGVGQPRDGDPRASYAIYDSGDKSVRFIRVAYDIAATQAKMLKYGLPVGLIARLSYGI